MRRMPRNLSRKLYVTRPNLKGSDVQMGSWALSCQMGGRVVPPPPPPPPVSLGLAAASSAAARAGGAPGVFQQPGGDTGRHPQQRGAVHGCANDRARGVPQRGGIEQWAQRVGIGADVGVPEQSRGEGLRSFWTGS